MRTHLLIYASYRVRSLLGLQKVFVHLSSKYAK